MDDHTLIIATLGFILSVIVQVYIGGWWIIPVALAMMYAIFRAAGKGEI